jgi:signal recognition particle GTPase
MNKNNFFEHKGNLIAHGTSYFLKNKFGRGYYLTFAKKTPTFETNESPVPMDIDYDQPSLRSNISIDSGRNSLSEELNVIKQEIIELDNPKCSVDEEGDDEETLESFEKSQKKNEENALKTLVTTQDMRIHEFVKKEIENSILIENIGTEMTYSISNKIEYTKNYENFFQKIENKMDYLGRSNFF